MRAAAHSQPVYHEEKYHPRSEDPTLVHWDVTHNHLPFPWPCMGFTIPFLCHLLQICHLSLCKNAFPSMSSQSIIRTT